MTKPTANPKPEGKTMGEVCKPASPAVEQLCTDLCRRLRSELLAAGIPAECTDSLAGRISIALMAFESLSIFVGHALNIAIHIPDRPGLGPRTLHFTHKEAPRTRDDDPAHVWARHSKHDEPAS